MRRIIALLVVLVVVVVGSRLCVRKVPLGFVGVRQNMFLNTIDLHDLQPGYHFVVPQMHKLHLIPSTLQIINFGGTGMGTPYPSFELRAKDEYTVKLDITFLWRVQQGNAARFLQSIGPSIELAERVFRVEGAKELQAVLGEMTTEDFYDAETRSAKAQDARRAFDLFTSRSFITVEAVLVRDVEYDERFETQIRERQVLEQERLLQASLTQKEKEQQVTETIEKDTLAIELETQAETDKAFRTLVAEAQARIAVVGASAELSAQSSIADASRYYRERVAEGELFKTQAEAQGLQAIAAAYQGEGGSLYLLRQMVDNLELGEIEINTNRTNPFDVRELLEMLGAAHQPFAVEQR